MTRPNPTPPKWIWLAPILFVTLGALRSYNIWKQFQKFHEYIRRIEGAFSGADDPGGWEHFLGIGNTTLFQSTGIFWIVLFVATIVVAALELSN